MKRLLGFIALITAAVLLLIGVRHWQASARFTEAAEGEISQRTDDFVAIKLTAPIPGGSATVELASTPDEVDQAKLGDKVTLVFPPGRPSDAQLASRLSTTRSTTYLAAGCAIAIFGAGLLIATSRWPQY